MKSSSVCVLKVFLSILFLGLSAADWPRFRGPNGSAISQDGNLPTRWSDTENLVWKTELPGPGTSSPVTHGDLIFLTSYSGYGADRNDPGNQETLQRHIICFSRADGKILWDKKVQPKLPEDSYQGFLREHGYASSTPVVDDEKVYVFFGKAGVLAFDHQGDEKWRVDVGSGSAIRGWGSAASPMIYKDLVIVNASAESEAIVALDRHTGKEKWRASSEGYNGTWSTPILVESAEGRQDLVISVPDEVWGINPDNGKLRWYALATEGSPNCTSLVGKDGVVYALGGRSGKSVAIRTGGKGDVTKTHVLWTGKSGSYVTSPLIHGQYLYWVSDRGIANCLKADSGEEVFKKRLPGAGKLYASIVMADEKLYAVTRDNGTFVLAAKPEFEQLAHNKIAGDESIFNASPAVSNGQLLIRSNRFLYCFGKP